MTTSAGTGRLEWRLEDDWAVVATGETHEPTADAVRGLLRTLDDDERQPSVIDLSASTRTPGGVMLGGLAACVVTLDPVADHLHVVVASGTDAAALAPSPLGPILRVSPPVDQVLAKPPAKQSGPTA